MSDNQDQREFWTPSPAGLFLFVLAVGTPSYVQLAFSVPSPSNQENHDSEQTKTQIWNFKNREVKQSSLSHNIYDISR